MAIASEKQKIQRQYADMLRRGISAIYQLESLARTLGKYDFCLHEEDLRKYCTAWYEREKEKLRAKEKVPRDLGTHQE